MSKVIGIYGGSFNPITCGHVNVANGVLDSGLVDEVRLVPCFSHNHNKELVHWTHRTLMIRQALNGNPKIRLSFFDILHESSGKTIEFISEYKNLLSKTQPDATIKFIIGLDNANTIATWYSYKELLKEVSFVVVERKGVERKSEWFLKSPHHFLDISEKIGNMSSTSVRNAFRDYYESEGEFKTKSWLIGAVGRQNFDYITENKLYKK